jgi:hypothetical protein
VASALAEPAVKYWPAGQVVAVFVEQDVMALLQTLKSDAAQLEHVVALVLRVDELDEYGIECSAVCQAAAMALPLSASAPSGAMYEAWIPVVFDPPCASTSPAVRPVVMVAVALVTGRLASVA